MGSMLSHTTNLHLRGHQLASFGPVTATLGQLTAGRGVDLSNERAQKIDSRTFVDPGRRGLGGK